MPCGDALRPRSARLHPLLVESHEMDISNQIREGRLVCPISHQPLIEQGDELVTRDGSRHYPVISGVPILHVEPGRIATYRDQGRGQMHREYRVPRSWARRAVTALATPPSDYRSEASQKAFAAVTTDLPAPALRLSIGGGPGRPHPSLTNLNIDLFANVDVVGDAYALPYADASVDAIHCEAVLGGPCYPSIESSIRGVRPPSSPLVFLR